MRPSGCIRWSSWQHPGVSWPATEIATKAGHGRQRRVSWQEREANGRCRLILCHALEDQAKIRLLPNVPTATADAQGRFSFRGFDPAEVDHHLSAGGGRCCDTE